MSEDPQRAAWQYRHDRLAREEALRGALVDGLGLKPRVAFGPVRTAISGRRVSPPLFESMQILGKIDSIDRIDRLAARLG